MAALRRRCLFQMAHALPLGARRVLVPARFFLWAGATLMKTLTVLRMGGRRSRPSGLAGRGKVSLADTLRLEDLASKAA